jgi:hypothetical protein
MRLVRGIAISSDGTLLCACDSDGHITLWDISKDNQYSFPSYIEACARSRARSSCWGCAFGGGPLARVALVHCEDSYIVPVSVDLNNILASTHEKRGGGEHDLGLSLNHSLSGGVYELGDGPGQLHVFNQAAEFEALIDDECGWCNVLPLHIDGNSCLCVLDELHAASSSDDTKSKKENIWVDVIGIRYRSEPVSEEEVLEEGDSVLVCIPRGDRDVHFDAEVVDFVPGGGLQVPACMHCFVFDSRGMSRGIADMHAYIHEFIPRGRTL